ncbi:CoA transferase [Paenibacillus hemerocallicola]|uniref:CoA transferase n=1 Tax=Paenibacillus hemerocallicola TaxID=1172614 RepID=A0A5C4SYE0_9BACL|nr:CoA transferase [Paenibacillus hemerocallicola]TNJ61618.1 CoA transferase [Paenibacillus hemerocallicola]
MKPLEGIRVLSVSQYGAGPYATLQLADLGAEVIKIEDPHTGGDVSRSVIPYAEQGDSLYYQAFNRNKKSVTLDLKSETGRTLFRQLAAKSDAVFNNLRGDVPAKLGLTYEQLKDVNPLIVTCSLSGFGTSGSMKAEPAYDYLLQAMLGHMSLTGDPSGPPEKYGLSMIDFSTGMMAALGLMVGLLRAKTRGEGCDVDVSLFDTAASVLNYLAIWNLNKGYVPQKTAHSAHPSLVPSQLFPTKDGHIVIMCNKEKFFPALCRAIEAPHLAEDARFANFESRFEHKEALVAELIAVFERENKAHWLEKLQGVVPVAPVNTVEEAMKHPLLRERDMIVSVDHASFGEVSMIGTPIKVSGRKPDYRAAPALGADNEEIYGGLLGLSRAELDRLAAERIV